MAAALLSTRPGNGQNGGECVIYAGSKCFGILFGADYAEDIWTNTKTNSGASLPYKKYNTMPSLPCCIVWGNGDSGHVGVIESKSNGVYRYSDSNRVGKHIVGVITEGLESEGDIKDIIGEDDFLGYVKFN